VGHHTSAMAKRSVEVPFCKMHGLGNDFIVVVEPLAQSKSFRSSSESVTEDCPLSPLLETLASTTHAFPSYVPAAWRARSIWAGGAGALAKYLCTRRFSVGADGLALLLPPSPADSSSAALRPFHFRFELYNPDGSAAPMCGNALRCATKLVWERRHQLLPDWLWGHNHASSNGGPTLCVETPAGTMVAHLTVGCDGSLVEAVRVDMGKPNFARSAIPCSPLGSVGADASLPVLNENFTFNGVKYEFSSLVIGVPHTVVFIEDPEKLPLYTLGPAIEKDLSIFPQGTNVGFVHILSCNKLSYWSWERGAGETLACGTGASAATVVAAVLGHIDPMKPVHTQLAGGDLTIRVDTLPGWADSKERHQLVERVWMEGPANIVFDGIAHVPL